MEVGISEPLYLSRPQAQLPSMAASRLAGSVMVADIVAQVDVKPQNGGTHVYAPVPAPMLDVKRE